LEERIKRIMEREELSHEEAERFVVENDKARQTYFHRFFRVQAEDPRGLVDTARVTLYDDWRYYYDLADDVCVGGGRNTRSSRGGGYRAAPAIKPV
jgi:hypothetical protein